MKDFSVSIKNLDYILSCRDFEEVYMDAKGQLDCGNLFSIYIAFNLDGSIKRFSLYNKDCDTLDFYSEIHQATDKIKVVQSKLDLLLEEIYKEKDNYNNEISELINEISGIRHKIRNLKKEMDELIEKYKKARGKNRLNLESEINDKETKKKYEIENECLLEEKIEKILGMYMEKLQNRCTEILNKYLISSI